MTTHNAPRQRAFKALTTAVIISIFGDSPSKYDVGPRKHYAIVGSDIDELDGETVQRGLDMVMLGHRPDMGLENLSHSGFLGSLLPDVQAMVGFGGLDDGHKDLWDHTKRVVRNAPPKLETRWAALFHDVGKPKTFRRKAGKVTFHGHEAASVAAFQRACETTVMFPDREFRENVSAMIETLGHIESYTQDWTDSAVRRVRGRIVEEKVWIDLLDLARSDCTSAHASNRDRAKAKTDELEARAKELKRLEDDELRFKPPKGTGSVVAKSLGIDGRELGAAMKNIEYHIRTGIVKNNELPEVYANMLHELGFDESDVIDVHLRNLRAK